MFKKFSFLVLAGLVALTLTTGCSDDDDNGMEPETPVDQFEVVREALDGWISTATPTIAAQDLLDNISENPSDDPYILSVRSATHYAIGHIRGAENVGWRDVGDPANLTDLPMNRQVVVYCYTGHTGQLATTALGAMGYDAINLKFGIMSWTSNTDVRAQTPFTEDSVVEGPFETGAVPFTETYELPELDVTSSDDDLAIIQAAYNAAWSEAGPVISAADLLDNISENPSDDPFILSVRSAEHFENGGHIPGAYNIPWRTVTDAANLQYLPTDRQIVVYCYTGHTGQVATAALRMLGYDAKNLKHGMCAWTANPDVRIATAFNEGMAVEGPLEP